METQVINATEYRDLPLSLLNESKTNPRRTFDENCLEGTGRSPSAARAFFRRCWCGLSRRTASRSSSGRGVTAPRRWPNRAPFPFASCNMSDAEALEAQLVENLIRAGDSPDGRGAGLPRLAGLGRPEVQHRADRREGGQVARHSSLRG